jgi:HSP90 family molecular chaperone
VKSNTSENLTSTVNIRHLLRILEERMYEDKMACIREYVANSFDACGHITNPLIHVRAEHDSLTFTDNGCGMNRERIINGFTSIAGHWVNEHSKGKTIGQFGLGVLSAFMIANKIEVETRSTDEPHGWRLEWQRGSEIYSLAAIPRSERGTTVRLCLMPDMEMFGSERRVIEYITRTFTLLPCPIRVGRGEGRVVNPHHAWVSRVLAGRKEALLTDTQQIDLLRDTGPARKDLVAAYAGQLSDGATLYLGIPRHKFEPYAGQHNVSFFSHGVRVLDQPREFLDPGLAFLTALLDSHSLKVKLSRDAVITDDGFTAVKGEVRHHAIRFFELLAESRPAVVSEALRTHSQMLIAEALNDPRILELLRRHFPFEVASSSEKRWAELRREARPVTPGGRPTLYYLTNPHARPQMAEVLDKGHQIVFPHPAALMLLERFAEADGIELVDVEQRKRDEESVPPRVQILVNRLTPFLHNRGILDVECLRNPQANAPPATFRVRQIAPSRRNVLNSNSDRPDEAQGVQIAIEALQLNLSHRLVSELVARVDTLREDALERAAEVLFEVATLNSPFEGVRYRITPQVCQSLINGFLREIGGYVATATGIHAQCFIAMPYRPEFENVWGAVRNILEGDPYRWTLLRADNDIRPVGLLSSLMSHIDASHRFIAEVSQQHGTWNPNVLLELGMMLQKKKENTLILADKETAEVLPIDLRGEVLAVYPSELRKKPEEFAKWFDEEVAKHRHFCSLFGAGSSGAHA